MNTRRTAEAKYEPIAFKMHPRVFAALGADLVTSDVVAVIELVKNSYDAFAENVWVRFLTDDVGVPYLEIEDDGMGMSWDIIENVWCMVATPHKVEYQIVKSGTKQRRVVGEKGLGRLSVARLGDGLQMLTREEGRRCVELKVNWTEISDSENLKDCFAKVRYYPDSSPIEVCGTIIRVFNLKGHWEESAYAELEDNLARLISPFSRTGDFNIYLSSESNKRSEEVRVSAPTFLKKPKYLIKGKVDDHGNVNGVYRYRSIFDGSARDANISHSWAQIYDEIKDKKKFAYSNERASCGKFEFEIRAWDVAPEDTEEIAEKFGTRKSLIRKAIRAHKGISIYRDGILVLPKSDSTRDWLGLDLRRVSKVGTRMSTSQIVGYVSISADRNYRIEDTSDRERLVSTQEVGEFEEILKSVIGLMENERDQDRMKREKPAPMDDLFGELSMDGLLDEVMALADEGAGADDAVSVIRSFSTALEYTRDRIQERFFYYSRLATVGTIAHMLVHEIRNRTTAVGCFLNIAEKRFGPFQEKRILGEYQRANRGIDALEKLADTFSPLASRSFRRKSRHSNLEERIAECLLLLNSEAETKKIDVTFNAKSKTDVEVDPAELDSVVLNLLNNSMYWLGQVDKAERFIEIKITKFAQGSRAKVWIHDSGPGVDEEWGNKVFWPGVTKKPEGIGMGLTVASELVAGYGGKMTLKHPGSLGGASFSFDLPLLKKGGS